VYRKMMFYRCLPALLMMQFPFCELCACVDAVLPGLQLLT